MCKGTTFCRNINQLQGICIYRSPLYQDAAYHYTPSDKTHTSWFKDIEWQWQDYYDEVWLALYFSWNRRQLNNSVGTEHWRSNIWGNENKWLEGISSGVQIFPAFDFGVGIYTGLFFDIYYSEHGNTEFGELNMFIPADLSFRLPFSEQTALYLYGGLGVDIGLFNGFYPTKLEIDLYYPYYKTTQKNTEYENAYGDWTPCRWGLSYNYGLSLRFNSVMFNFMWQKGFAPDSHIYEDSNVISKWNKLQIGISVVIP